jgi:hypothetical protein
MSTTMEDVRDEERAEAEHRKAEGKALEKLVRSIAAAAARQTDNARLHEIGNELGQLLGFREAGVPDTVDLMIRAVTLAAEALDATAKRD